MCVCVGVGMCENIHMTAFLGVFLHVCVCAFAFVCVCVFSSPEQSSGNVWVTHEEMENLASSTKAVSTIWVLPPSPSPISSTKHSLTLTLSLPRHTYVLSRKTPLNTYYITC